MATMIFNNNNKKRRGSRRLSGGQLIALITLVDTMSSIWFGYCQGVFAGVLISPDFLAQFPQTSSNSNVSGIVTSSFLLGAFVAASLLAILNLSEKYGRLKIIGAGHTLNFVGACLQFLIFSSGGDGGGGKELAQMIIGRVINGFGIGLTSTMSPVYLSECAPTRWRGLLVVIGASSNVASFCLANWISYGLFDRGDGFQWRFPLAFQLVFGLVIFPVLAVVPESPRWLLMVDRDAEALEVISRLIIGSGSSVQGGEEMDSEERVPAPLENNPLVQAEYRSIKSAIQLERRTSHSVPLSQVLRNQDATQNLRRLILSCGTQFMQQFSGINALGFYLPTLLHESVGYDLQMSRLLTAVSGTVYLVAAFGSLLVIDHVGRRKLMLFGSIACGLCHLIASMCLRAGAQDPSKTKLMGEVAVAMFVIYHVCFAPTLGGVPWVYAAEVNSLGWRTKGAAAATGTNWIMGFVVVQFTKVGIDNLGWAFYLIFAVICFSYFPIIFCFYPETSRRSLEDMDEMFMKSSKSSWFVCGNRELTQRERPERLIEAEKERIAASETPSPPSGVLEEEGEGKRKEGGVAVQTTIMSV